MSAGALVRMSAALAARAEGALDASLRELDGAGDPVAVEEALLQSYLFLGYPVALNGLARWRALSGRPAPAATGDDWPQWERAGARVCGQVYGEQYAGLRANVRALHPDLERWMVAEGYGKVLARPGLALVDRELCIVAMLVVQDQPRQLHSHLRGALRVGASVAQVEDALAAAAAFAGAAALERARATWRRVREGRAGAETGGTAEAEPSGGDEPAG